MTDHPDNKQGPEHADAPDHRESQDRQDLMQRDVLLMVTAGIALVNGMHSSPFFDPVFILLRPFAAGLSLTSPLVLLYFTSLLISLLTLMIGGIPAALYERAKGLDHSTPSSLGLWAACVTLISIPSLIGLAG